MDTLNTTPSSYPDNQPENIEAAELYFNHRLDRLSLSLPLESGEFSDQVDASLSRCKGMLSLFMAHITDKSMWINYAALSGALEACVCEIQDINALTRAFHEEQCRCIKLFFTDAEQLVPPKKSGGLKIDFSHRYAGYERFLTDTGELQDLINAMAMRCIGGLELLKSHCDGDDRFFDQDTLYFAADSVLKGVEDIEVVINALSDTHQQQA